MTTQFPSGGTPEEIAAIQQVQAEYDIAQNKGGLGDESNSKE